MFNSQNLPYYGPFVKQVKPAYKPVEPCKLMIVSPDDDELRAIVRNQQDETRHIIQTAKREAIEELDGLWAEYLTA